MRIKFFASLFGTSMGSSNSKHLRERCRDYRPLSACSETESASVVSSVASNAAVGKRLSRVESLRGSDCPAVPHSPVPERPCSPKSIPEEPMENESDEDIPDIPARNRIDSCGGTVNSPLRRPSPQSPSVSVGRSQWTRYPRACPAAGSETSLPADSAPYGAAKGHRINKPRSQFILAPRNERHSWTWNLPAVDDTDNAGHVSEREISMMLRGLSQAVREQLHHPLHDNEEYHVEVKLTKVRKPTQEQQKCNLARSHSHRDHPEAEKHYSVPLRKHLVARELATARETPVYASCAVVPKFNRGHKTSVQYAPWETKDQHLARIILENHERNNITVQPKFSTPHVGGSRKERLSRHFERDKVVVQKDRFLQADLSVTGGGQFENRVSTVYHHHLHQSVRIPAKSTLI